MAEQEAVVLDLVRGVAAGLLLALLPLTVRELRLPQAGQRHPCPACGVSCGVQEWRRRIVLTCCGGLRYQRPWYRCRACHHSWAPADGVLEVDGYQRVSAGLDQWLIALGRDGFPRGGGGAARTDRGTGRPGDGAATH